MPDDATPIPAAPAPPSPNPAPAPDPKPAAPSEADVTAAIDSLGELTAAQLDAIEKGDFTSLIGTDPKPDGDKKPDPKPETKPEGEKTPEGDKPTEKKGGNPADIHRISLGGMAPESRAKLVQFTTLVKSGMSEAEASAQVYGATKAAEAPKEGDKTVEKAPDAAPEVPESIKSIESAIEAKKAEIAKVKEAYGDSTDLLEELQDLKLDLREAKREHERASATQASFQADVQKSLEKVMSEHADLWTDVKPGQTMSEFESYCEDEYLLATAKNDPVMQRPDWPENIAKRVMDKFFKGRGANSADPGDDDPPIPPLPKQAVRLPGSLTGNPDAPGVFTPGNIEAQFDTLSEEQQLEVLKKSGG